MCKLFINDDPELCEVDPENRDKWWVIDIGGNHLRMIAFIEVCDKRMDVKHICSHAEYDRLTDKYRRNKE